jgi:uncharacterized protein YjbI with pentapeptide repeats
MLRTLGIKGMAKALRQALSDRKIELSHSDCLELIAKQFGVKDWNTHRTTQRLDVNDTDLSGSRFNDANLTGTWFNQINFSGAKFNDSNMTGWYVNDVNLSGSQFQNINLSGVTFSNCRMPGAMLDGVPLEEIVAAYRKSQAS